ncbi:MAG: hypothetical protein FWF02_04640 [Micrococcales bacterium]|nr:hypothetical protein [Micrococcales bacterium]MCL2666979.1 hypothetical protein [Micrococcales bacterium]
MTPATPSGLPDEAEHTVMVSHGAVPAAPDTTPLDEPDLEETDVDDTDEQVVVVRPLRALLAPPPVSGDLEDTDEQDVVARPLRALLGPPVPMISPPPGSVSPPAAPAPGGPGTPGLGVPGGPASAPVGLVRDPGLAAASLAQDVEDPEPTFMVSRLSLPVAPGPTGQSADAAEEVERTIMVSSEARAHALAVPLPPLAPVRLPPTVPLDDAGGDTVIDVERGGMVSRPVGPPPGHSTVPALGRGPAPVSPVDDDGVEHTLMVSRMPPSGGVRTSLPLAAAPLPPLPGAPAGIAPLTEGTVVVPRALGPATDGTIVVPRNVGPATDGTIVVPRNVGPPTDGTIVVPRTLGPPTDGTLMVSPYMGRSGLSEPALRGPNSTVALPKVVPVAEERPRYTPRPVPVEPPPLQVLEGPTVGRGNQRLSSVALASRRTARTAVVVWVLLCGLCATGAYWCATQLFG